MDSPTVSSSKSFFFFFPNSWYAYFLLVLSFVKILFAYTCFIKTVYLLDLCFQWRHKKKSYELMSVWVPSRNWDDQFKRSSHTFPIQMPFLAVSCMANHYFCLYRQMPSMGNVCLFIYLLSFRQFLVSDLGCFPYRTIHSSLTLSRENNLWLGATVYLLLLCFSSFLLSEHCRSVVIIMLLAWGKYILREYLCR